MKKERDYTASLTVYGIPSMQKRGRNSLANWLKKIAYQLENCNPEEYSDGRVSFRLMTGKESLKKMYKK